MEKNDPTLVEIVFLPMKNFGVAEVERLAAALGECILYCSMKSRIQVLLKGFRLATNI